MREEVFLWVGEVEDKVWMARKFVGWEFYVMDGRYRAKYDGEMVRWWLVALYE
jgi:hypothetical protein